MSSLRKWFSSNSMLRTVQIYFCLTVIGTFVQAEFYKVSSITPMRLDNLDLTISGSTVLLIKRHDKNSYTAQLVGTYISTTHFIPDIQVSGCADFKQAAIALKKSYKVLLDDNGQFKSMQFSKDDIPLSMAMKFLIAVQLQDNTEKLEKQTGNFDFNDIAVSQYGKCTQNNKGSKANDKYNYKSFLQPNTCSSLESPAAKDDEEFAASICRDPKERSSYYSFLTYNTISVNSKTNEFSELKTNKRLSYIPHKNSDQFLFSGTTHVFELNPKRLGSVIEDQIGSRREPEPFNDADSKEVTELPYINIDRSMAQMAQGNKAVKMYKGLACQPVKTNTFLAILRIAARCR